MSKSSVVDVGQALLRALVDIFIAASQGDSPTLQKDICIEVVQVLSSKLSEANRNFASVSQPDSNQAKHQAEEQLVMLRVVSSVFNAMGNADMRDVPKDLREPLQSALK